MKVFRLKETTSLSQRNSTLTTQTSACLQEHAGLTKVSNWSLIRSSSSKTWASFFTKSWALPGSGRFPVHREISACHSEIDVKSGWEGHPAITFVHFSCLKGRAEFREMPYLWSPWLWQTQPCWMLQTENKQAQLQKNLLETSIVQLLQSVVCVSYLGFFDQVQQVFDMVSQQILALPHLIQSSAGERSKGHNDVFARPPLIHMLLHNN